MKIITDQVELLKPCQDVDPAEGLLIAARLIQFLESHPTGIGLAAPQVGLHSRVFCIRYKDYISSFINPRIIQMKEPFINEKEGCLSFPGVFVDTIRYNKIVIKDAFAETKLEGLPAVIAQHEVEHLDLKTFLNSKVPERYDDCFCGSEKKFKFCCFKKVNASKIH